MSRYWLSAAAFALVILLGGASSTLALPSNTSMHDGGYALAPFSFAQFCIEYPVECPAFGGAARVELTTLRLAQLSAVNRSVNAHIAPTADKSVLRYWHLNVAAGDCNSFAVQKRHELLSLGWPAGALALTVAKTSWGEGHLVVTVRTDRGDLVLDNLRSRIVSWRETGYQFILRQSETNPQFWVELHGGMVGKTFEDQDRPAAATLKARSQVRHFYEASGLAAAVVSWIIGNRLPAATEGAMATLVRFVAATTSLDSGLAVAVSIDPTEYGFI